MVFKGKKLNLIPWNKGLHGVYGGWKHSQITKDKMKNSAIRRMIKYPTTNPSNLGKTTRYKKGQIGTMKKVSKCLMKCGIL